MMRRIDVIYERGVLRPLQTLEDIAEHTHLKITVESVNEVENSVDDCIGILPDEDAAEMRRIVEEEFEQVHFGEW